jgi:hypothetical protein
VLILDEKQIHLVKINLYFYYLTNNGEVDPEVLGPRVQVVDSAPINTLIFSLDIFDAEFSNSVRRAHERRPESKSAGHGPMWSRFECTFSGIDAETRAKGQFS